MEYLYTTDQGIDRYEITRETNANVWIKLREGYEKKISKNTYRTDNEWSHTYWHRETPQILDAYLKQIKIRNYKNKLIKLQNCQDEKIINLILDIEI